MAQLIQSIIGLKNRLQLCLVYFWCFSIKTTESIQYTYLSINNVEKLYIRYRELKHEEEQNIDPNQKRRTPTKMIYEKTQLLQGLSFFLLIISAIISLRLNDYSSWAINMCLAFMVLSAGNLSQKSDTDFLRYNQTTSGLFYARALYQPKIQTQYPSTPSTGRLNVLTFILIYFLVIV